MNLAHQEMEYPEKLYDNNQMKLRLEELVAWIAKIPKKSQKKERSDELDTSLDANAKEGVQKWKKFERTRKKLRYFYHVV